LRGLWKAVHDKLRAKVHKQAVRNASPGAAILDRRSVKTTEIGGGDCCHDKEKNVKERKRLAPVDAMGLVLNAVVRSDLDDGSFSPTMRLVPRESAVHLIRQLKRRTRALQSLG
jgi:hypothetical protein